MNLLEHYIKEIHNVESYEVSWTKELAHKKFVKVDMTHNCWGDLKRETQIFDTNQWEQIKEQGYFMA